LFTLFDLQKAKADQAFSEEFLKIKDIEAEMSIAFNYSILTVAWFAFILACIFGAVYYLGFEHGRVAGPRKHR